MGVIDWLNANDGAIIGMATEDLHRITTGSRKPIILTESLSEHHLGQRTNS